ncbi:MAG: PhnD/SsuA/transferrin family substrate-binding protein, partial [Gammaproteobacteria bacterium]|nr:PhnD/SsuA/transferrin family substrate-binding protein [Gammaproteobacteria bacterium]
MVSAQAKELPEEKKTLIFAVSNYLTPASVKAEYQPLIDHLNKSLKQIQVELRVFEINDFDDALRNQQVDFATTNP